MLNSFKCFFLSLKSCVCVGVGFWEKDFAVVSEICPQLNASINWVIMITLESERENGRGHAFRVLPQIKTPNSLGMK